MKNKFSFVSLLLNIMALFAFGHQFLGIKKLEEFEMVNLTAFFFPIIAIIVGIMLWWLIRLSRKRNESRFLFSVNCVLAVFNSFSLISQSSLIVLLLLFIMSQ